MITKMLTEIQETLIREKRQQQLFLFYYYLNQFSIIFYKVRTPSAEFP